MSGNLKELLAKKQLPSIITLFGEEDFLVYDAYKKIVAKFLNENPDSTIEVVDVDELKDKNEFKDVLEKAIMPNFFSSSKLCVIKNIEKIFSKKGKKDKLEPHETMFKKVLSNPPETCVFLFITFENSLFGISKKVQKDSKTIESLKFPFDLLLGNHYWIEFPKVNENQIRSWVANRLKELDYIAEPETIDFLLANTNPNLWEISTELEKIFAYMGDEHKIKLEDIRNVLSGSRDINIFQISSLISQRRVAETIDFVNNVLNTSRQELLLLTIILKFFKNLLILTEIAKQNSDRTQMAKAIGVSPYFLNDYLIGLRNYSKSEIEKAIREIVKVDHQLKSSSKDTKYLFIVLLTNIMQK